MLKKFLTFTICFLFYLLLFGSPGWIADFEEEDFSEFNGGETDTGGDLSVQNTVKHGGNWAMLDVIDDVTAAYVTETANLSGAEVHFSFYIKWSTVANVDWDGQDSLRIITSSDGSYRDFRFAVKNPNDEFLQVYAQFDIDGANDTYGWATWFSDTDWHEITIHLKFDVGGGGWHKLWFDDDLKHNSTGLTTTASIDGLRFGDITNAGADTRVSIYFDDFLDELAGNGEEENAIFFGINFGRKD